MAASGEDRDLSTGLVQLHAVAVELHLMKPGIAPGRALSLDRFARWDEDGGTRHGRDLTTSPTTGNQLCAPTVNAVRRPRNRTIERGRRISASGRNLQPFKA